VDVQVERDRYPVRLTVVLRGGTIEDGVHDVLDHYHATIEDASRTGGGLRLSLAVREPWKDAGTRSIRSHGKSLVLTLPREALDAAGLAEDSVAIHARQDEIHIARQTDEPLGPNR
jgi:hypothetical protein